MISRPENSPCPNPSYPNIWNDGGDVEFSDFPFQFHNPPEIPSLRILPLSPFARFRSWIRGLMR